VWVPVPPVCPVLYCKSNKLQPIYFLFKSSSLPVLASRQNNCPSHTTSSTHCVCLDEPTTVPALPPRPRDKTEAFGVLAAAASDGLCNNVAFEPRFRRFRGRFTSASSSCVILNSSHTPQKQSHCLCLAPYVVPQRRQHAAAPVLALRHDTASDVFLFSCRGGGSYPSEQP